MAKKVKKSVKMDANPWMNYHTEETMTKEEFSKKCVDKLNAILEQNENGEIVEETRE